MFALKITGILLSVVFGVLGTIHEFRLKNGKLTKWGKFSIIGAITSGAVAISAQLIEEDEKQQSTKMAAEQALASTQRLEVIVHDLSRVLQPLDLRRIFIHRLSVPLEDPRFAPAKRRIETEIGKYLNARESGTLDLRATRTINESVTRRDEITGKHKTGIIEVSPKNPSFPRRGLEFDVLYVDTVMLSLYRNPVKPKQFESAMRSSPEDADLRITFSLRSPEDEALSLAKDFDNQKYALSGALYAIDNLTEDRTGRLVAFPDLAGAQIFLTLSQRGLPEWIKPEDLGLPRSTKFSKTTEITDLQARFEIGSVAFTFGSKTVWVNEYDWTKHIGHGGYPYWEYTFPKNQFFPTSNSRKSS